MDGVSLLFALENEFDINIPDEAAKSIRSVQDMVDGVKKILEHGGTLPPDAVPTAPDAKESVEGANEGAPVA